MADEDAVALKKWGEIKNLNSKGKNMIFSTKIANTIAVVNSESEYSRVIFNRIIVNPVSEKQKQSLSVYYPKNNNDSFIETFGEKNVYGSVNIDVFFPSHYTDKFKKDQARRFWKNLKWNDAAALAMLGGGLKKPKKSRRRNIKKRRSTKKMFSFL
jgi:hypothetical protein